MSLVPSLLQAIVRVDGEALVMHVGEKPYVVSPNGQVDLATRGLTFEAVNGIVAQLLPADALKSLEDVGATQFELPTLDEFPGEHFTVTAARGGDDVWAEIRRRQVPEDDLLPADIFTGLPAAARADEASLAVQELVAVSAPVGAPEDLALPKEDQLWPNRPAALTPEQVADDLRIVAPDREVADHSALAFEPAQETVAHSPLADVVNAAAEAKVEEQPFAEDPIADEPVHQQAALDVPVYVTDASFLDLPPLSALAHAPLRLEDLIAVAPPRSAFEPIAEPLPEVAERAFIDVPEDFGLPAVMATSAELELAPMTAVFEPAPMLEPVVAFDAMSEPEPVAEPEAAAEPEAIAEPEVAAEPGAIAEPEPAAEAEALPEADFIAELEPVAELDAAAESQPVVEEPVEAHQPAVVERAALVLVPELPSVPESVPEFATQVAPALSEARAAAQLSEAVMSTLPSDYPNFVALDPSMAASANPVEVATPAPFTGALSESRVAPADVQIASSFVPFPPLNETPQSAVVLPIARGTVREGGAMNGESASGALERLVRLAASRGASALYLSSNARPAVRLDGDIQTLDGTSQQSPQDVEQLLADALGERSAGSLGPGGSQEWVWDLSEVGRVRCTSFRDHRGPGAVFRIVSVRPQSASQLGLSREIQSLAAETEGLILVSGPRANGKSTLISSFVDLINRTRRDYVITIESEINIVHDRQGAFVSQREVRGGSEDVLAAARAALREEPDVLVLEDLRTSALMGLALDAAAAGQLIIGGVPAHHASGAIDRLIELYQPDQRRQAQLSLAQNLRGVVTQVLLRKSGGGRVAAREVLLNTPLVSSLLAEGRTTQLPVAIEGGRKNGMVPLNDALVGFVQSGAVDVREAYRRASDRAGLLDLLKRQGIDTSFIERLA